MASKAIELHHMHMSRIPLTSVITTLRNKSSYACERDDNVEFIKCSHGARFIIANLGLDCNG